MIWDFSLLILGVLGGVTPLKRRPLWMVPNAVFSKNQNARKWGNRFTKLKTNKIRIAWKNYGHCAPPPQQPLLRYIWRPISERQPRHEFAELRRVSLLSHNGCFWNLLSIKYLRKISILVTNMWKIRKNKNNFYVSTFKIDITKALKRNHWANFKEHTFGDH